MAVLYSIFIEVFIIVFKLFAMFNAKARKGLLGRNTAIDSVQSQLNGKSVIWMHAASLGEYEQGLPVLEQLKTEFPDSKILISFFSPSGYENVIKKENIADLIIYLPFDRKSTMQKLVNAMDVKIFFTVKYDYWYHLLRALKSKNTKIFVVSALFYEGQVFFKMYGGWFSKQLKTCLDWAFHQTVGSSALAKSVGINQSSVTGDTRFDRVKQLKNRDNHVPFISEYVFNRRSIVLGSSWDAEEKAAQVLHKKLPKTKLIIAPHDLKRVPHLRLLFPQALLYSEINERTDLESNVLIIDSIGLLSKLYSYATLAVVGGGFHSAGLHNILEAAAFGIPVFFGDQYKKNPEADALIKMNGGKNFSDEFAMAGYIEELIKSANRTPIDEVSTLKEMSENAKFFVESQPYATKKILAKILSFFPEKTVV
ncbi:glycosyltransferase N-terminal domain-containing protein [Soonwooa sp.]|uniref:3-deoxy-D-manno-octulosonic acid transferase n=1 Tax=Soonwooa sp. TaxID=1938592 RepID=UPI0028B1A11F|nr:glycosyltransferase N-terminal domain-containing protein [Soonwooa sp.]